MERLQKIIARAGIASRREAERLILEGEVTVNGLAVRTPGSVADASKDRIKVRGKLITKLPPPVYILLNKPPGYLTTLKDPQARPHVRELLKRVKIRVFPVGRLDYDAEGLLLLTNDGPLANLLTHPRYQVPRSYQVRVSGYLGAGELDRLRKGVELEDGMTLPAQARATRMRPRDSLVRITIREGRNRQIKRMFDALGHRVIRIKRTGFGPLRLGDLMVGRYRYMTPEEIAHLKRLAQDSGGGFEQGDIDKVRKSHGRRGAK